MFLTNDMAVISLILTTVAVVVLTISSLATEAWHRGHHTHA